MRWNNYKLPTCATSFLLLILPCLSLASDSDSYLDKAKALGDLRASIKFDDINSFEKINKAIEQAIVNNDSALEAYALILLSNLHIVHGDPRQAKQSLERARPLIKNHNPELVIRFKIVEIETMTRLGEFSDHQKRLVQLESSLPQTNDAKLLGDASLTLGYAYLDKMQYQKSLTLFTKALEYYSEINNKKSIRSVLGAVTEVSVIQENLELAEQYARQAIAISKESGNKLNLSIDYANLGRVLFHKEDYESAIFYMSESITLGTELELWNELAKTKQALGTLYVKTGKIDQAITQLTQTIKTFRETNSKIWIFHNAKVLGDAYLKRGDLENAALYIEEANSLSDEIQSLSSILELNNVQILLEKKRGNTDKVVALLEKRLTIKDELDQNAREQEVQRYQFQFDTELKEMQNQVLQKELEQTEIENQQIKKQERLTSTILGLSLLLILGLIYTLWRQNYVSRKFKSLALLDQLTNSPNRRAINEFADAILSSEQADNISLAVAIADLDFFKSVNDTYGHQVGDNVLVSFSNACKQALRQSDSFGRYGGEEWLLVFVNAGPKDIEQIFERISVYLSADKTTGLPDDENITFSMGVAFRETASNQPLQALISKADNMLYKAKERGRNQLAVDALESSS